MLEVELHPAQVEDKSVLRNLMKLYAYDFTEYDGADVDKHGSYGYDRSTVQSFFLEALQCNKITGARKTFLDGIS